MRCRGAERSLSALELAQFELTALEARGCRQRSPSVLDCTLDASGEASFGVQSRIQDDFNLNGYVPICVTPLYQRSKPPMEVAVIPHVGSSRVALAVVQLEGDEAIPASAQDASCDSFLACDEVRVRARLQVGVVSRDLPAASIRRSDFRPVTREVKLSAELQALTAAASGSAPFLTKNPDCQAPAPAASSGSGGADATEGVPLHIDAGQSASDVLYLCASSHASLSQVTATLVDSDASSPVLVPKEVSLRAVTHGYSAERQGEAWVLFSQACGELSRPAIPGAVPPQDSVSTDGQRVLLLCVAEAPGAGGAGGAGGAEASGGSGPTSCAISLQTGPAGTCNLKVGN